MYLCTTHNLKCPHKLSPEAPLPCTANQDLCDKYVESINLIRKQYPNESLYECHRPDNCPKPYDCSFAIFNNIAICTLPDKKYCEHQAIRQPLPKPTQNHIQIPINPILTLQLED